MAERDPYWLTARRPDRCMKCKRPIRRGEQVFYYPIGRTVLCAGSCGREAAADFAAHAADDAFAAG